MTLTRHNLSLDRTPVLYRETIGQVVLDRQEVGEVPGHQGFEDLVGPGRLIGAVAADPLLDPGVEANEECGVHACVEQGRGLLLTGNF